MTDRIELLTEQSAEPTLSNTRKAFTDVSNWRDYATSYAQDLTGYEVVSIENNICSGARPSYIPTEDPMEARMWFLPVELAREVNHRHNGMLTRLTLCYDRVDTATGEILSSDGLRWPPNVTGAKVTFNNLTDVDYSRFESEDIVQNVVSNIILSRQIENQAYRDAYLFYSLTNASLTVPCRYLEDLHADPAAVDKSSGLQEHYERFVFLFLFVRISPIIKGEVATPQFYTTCLRYRRLLESWRERQFIDYDELLCLKALFELETATEKPHGGLLYNRVSMLGYYEDCGLDDVTGREEYQQLQDDLNKALEKEEWSPLLSIPSEHRASGSIWIGEDQYRAPVRCSSPSVSSQNVGVQARLTGTTTCVTSFNGKPAVLRIGEGSMKLLRIDMRFVLKVIAWVAGNNPIYRLGDIANPMYGGYDSNRLILTALNMGLFGESGTEWILSQIVYGDVKVSSKSRNHFFRRLAQDDEGVRIDRTSRPSFTQQLAAFVCQDSVHLAVASDVFLELERRHGMWRVKRSHSLAHEVTGLGQFRTSRCVG